MTTGEPPLTSKTRLLIAALAACLPTASMLGAPQSVAADPFDWMQGDWCGGSVEERIEEHWLSAHGGLRLGIARTLEGERTASFEFLRIEMVDGVATYIAQPGGAPATSFKRTQGGASWVRFENPEHDFPKRVDYRRMGDALHAEIAGPGEDGKEVVVGFDFTACK
jgi:hypothetical protein